MNIRRAVKITDALTIATYLISILAFLAVYPHVEPAFAFLFLCFFFVALHCERKKRYVPTVILTCFALVIVALYLYRFSITTFAGLTVDSLMLLLAVKLLQKKQFRDYMQIYLIAVFLLAGSALLSVSLVFLFYLLVLVFLFNVAIVLLAYQGEDPATTVTFETMVKIVSKAALIPSLAIPLAALIFVITPRTPYPLLYFLNQGARAATGFSDSILLGKVSEIQEDDRIILRASMGKVDDSMLYWRGIVLDYFDGSSWRAQERGSGRRGGGRAPVGQGVWQEIYLEPYGDRYLFALDKPNLVLLREAREFGALTFALPSAVNKKIRYRVFSVLSDRLSGGNGSMDSYLQLPPNLSPRIRALALQLGSGRSAEKTVHSILAFLASGRFSYSLSNLPLTATPLEDFLFVTKQGNCEYFASAFAVLTRSAGIPVRLVAGYRGGYYSELGKYYLVAQKHAHVWAEVSLPGKGWVRFDPTPASAALPYPFTRDVFFTARLYLDMVNYYWIMFVVNYDLQKQFVLFGKVRTVFKGKAFKPRDWGDTRYVVPILLVPLLFLVFVRLRRRSRRSEEEKLIDAFLRHLHKYGYVRRPSQGLEEFAAEIREPFLRESCRSFVREFEETYYRDNRFTKAELKRLRQRIKELERGDCETVRGGDGKDRR